MAWGGTPVQATSAIPMMAANGTTPINTAANIRQGLLGALLAPAPASQFAWRAGVLPAWQPSGALWASDLAVWPTSPVSNQILVAAGNCVVPRTSAAGGPYLVSFTSTSTLNVDAGVSTNPRIDVVYVQLTDAALGDSGTQGGQLAIVNGTPAATPAVPAIPANAIPLCQLYRAVNATTVPSNTMTDMRKSTGLFGALRYLLPGDLNSDPGSYIGEVTYDSVTSKASGLRYWGNDNAWHGIGVRAFAQPSPAADVTHIGYTGTFNVATVTIPDPGFAYRITAVAQCNVVCNSANPTTPAGVDSLIFIGPTTGLPYSKTRYALTSGNPNNCAPEASLGPTQPFTGTQTVTYQLFNPTGSAYLDFQPSVVFQFRVSIIPA